MSQKNDDLLSTREAATMLGVSLRTIQLWVESGVLRAWKTAGGHRRVVRETVEALLSQKDEAIHGAVVADKARTLRILVIEDEPDLLKLYRLHISGWNLPTELATASNGFEGLISIGQQTPDLIITDLMMPGMDGFAMLRTLKNNPSFRHLQTIAVTALSAADVADQGGLPAGVELMRKPLDFAVLRQRVESCLDSKTGAN